MAHCCIQAATRAALIGSAASLDGAPPPDSGARHVSMAIHSPPPQRCLSLSRDDTSASRLSPGTQSSRSILQAGSKRAPSCIARAADAGALNQPLAGFGGGSGDDDGKFRGGGGGGGRGDGEGGGMAEGSGDAEEKGLLLSWAAVQKVLAEKGIQLPADMLEHAQREGLFSSYLDRYVALQRNKRRAARLEGKHNECTFLNSSHQAHRLMPCCTRPGKPQPHKDTARDTWENGFLHFFTKNNAGLRNRLLADPSFLFKVLIEVAIDSGCATFAEVQKRGSDFWKEFDLYASDMLVGIVMDVALVSMLAPVARFAPTGAAFEKLSEPAYKRFLSSLPSSMFEAAVPGQSYSLVQRGATWFVKAAEYGAVGFSCGLIGQGIANTIIEFKKSLRKGDASAHAEDEVKTPPLLQTACLWGVFMAISSNTRYQVVNGLEAVVEGSLVAQRFPPLARAFTVAVRFGNNVFGGMQFVDWARMSGVQ